jgi:hypothetical protein
VKTYRVAVLRTGYRGTVVEVQAENREEAERKAAEQKPFDFGTEYDYDITFDVEGEVSGD